MKVNEQKSCWGCKHSFPYMLPSRYMIEEQRKSHGDHGEFLCRKDEHRSSSLRELFINCPLPDWPRVSAKEAGLLFGFQTLSQEAVVGLLRSIGVEVEDEPPDQDSKLTMFASEEVLMREWDTPEEDEAWKNLDDQKADPGPAQDGEREKGE